MGNTKKLQAVTVAPLDLSSEQNKSVTECINLRHAPLGGLEVVGLPRKVADAAQQSENNQPTSNGLASSQTEIAALPFRVVEHPAAGRIALFAANQTFTARYLDAEPVREERVGTFTGEFLCSVAVGGSRVVAMTTHGPETIFIDESGACRIATHPDRFPPLRFSVFDEMTLTETVEAEDLRGDYTSRPSRLANDDADRLTADALRAYDTLCRTASGASLAFQPLLARYKLYGHDGELLYVSPTVVVGPSTGIQAVGELTCQLAANCAHRDSTTLSVKVFKIRLHTVGNYLSAPTDEVERLVVETSLPAHPVDLAGCCATAVDRRQDSTGTLRYFLPGVSVGMASSESAASARLRAMAACGDAVFRTAHVSMHPFRAGSAVDIVVAPATCGSASADIKAIERDLSAKSAGSSRVAALCRLPRRFAARCGDTAGGRVLWGNVASLPFRGYRPDQYALAEEDAGWDGSVIVEMADGERVAMSATGLHAAPAQFSPLLLYPSAEAVKLTISMRRGDRSFVREFPLVPSADGTFAYYLAPGCRPLALEESDAPYSLPQTTARVREFPTYVVNCCADSPLAATDAAEASAAQVVAVVGVARRNWSWDYSRRRCYVFSQSEIALANFAADGTLLPLQQLFADGIACPDAVAATTDADYPVVCISNGRLLAVNQNRIKVLEQKTDAVRIAWDAAESALWMADAEGRLQVMENLAGDRYSVAGMTACGMLATGRGLLISTRDGLRSTCDGRESGPTQFGYRCVVAAPRSPRSLRLLKVCAAEASLRASEIEGGFEVSTELGGTTRVALTGPVTNRVAVRLLPMAAAEVSVGVSGTAPAGSTISGFNLLFRRQ